MKRKVSWCYSKLLMVLFKKNSLGTKVVGGKSVKDMVSKLKKPRRVMMLVKAGDAVDKFIDQLVPELEKGDIIIDGGNSEYTDSIVGIFSFAMWSIVFCCVYT